MWSFFLFPIVAGLIVFIFAAPALGFANRGTSFLRFARVFFVGGISLSVIRAACFWALFYSERQGPGDLSLFPLALLLIPEGMLFAERLGRSIGQGILFGGLLVIGSFLWAALPGWSLSPRKRKTISG